MNLEMAEEFNHFPYIVELLIIMELTAIPHAGVPHKSP
jgi:hypothetical protein